MTVLRDLRFAVRALVKRPGFAAVVSLILALGMGTVTAVFSVLDRTLLQPLASEDPDRWVRPVEARGPDKNNNNFSYPLFSDLRDRAGVFDVVLAHAQLSLTIGGTGGVERIDGAGISAGFFTALGVDLPLGRDIAAEEDQPGAAVPVVVLSHGLWLRRYGGDPTILTRTIQLNGAPYTVIGVAPAGFLGPVRGMRQEAWVPLTTLTIAGPPEVFQRRTTSWLDVLARLKPGMSRPAAEVGLAVLQRQLAQDSLFPATSQLRLQDGSAGFTWLVGDLARPLTVLLGCSCLVLLVAAANLASLLLARAATRRRELAIRLALGASRLALGRLLFLEGLVLAVVGGAGALLVAAWLNSAAPSMHTLLGDPLALAGGLDLRVLLFVGTVSVLLAGGLAAVPVWWSAGLNLSGGIRDSSPTGGQRGSRVRSGLVLAQLALAVVLVAGALVLGITAQRLSRVDPGYDTAGVLLASVDLEAGGYNGAGAVTFWDQLLTRLVETGRVEAASVALTITPTPGGMHWGVIPLEGSSVPPEQVEFDMNLVGPDYFRTLRIPVLQGREFAATDRRGAQSVVIINQAMARRYWPDGSPLGRQVRLGDTTQPGSIVVGVVADGKYRSLREASLPVLYRPALEVPPLTGTLLLRGPAGGSPLTLVPLVREQVRALNPALPVFGAKPLSEHLGLARATERLLAFIAVVYAVLATVLAAIGLFGLLSYAVTCQTREIGIRVALGAAPGSVQRQVVWQGLGRGLAGVAIGVGLTVATGRLLRALLYDISPFDPLVLSGVGLLMLLVAVAASWWPARRAARVDPVVALKAE